MWVTRLNVSKCGGLITSTLFLWCIVACAQDTKDFLGFSPVSVERVASRSHDESMILRFESPQDASQEYAEVSEHTQEDASGGDDCADHMQEADEQEEGYKTLFYRKFRGKYAAARKRYFVKILEALSITGVAPYPVRTGDNEIVVTFVEGRGVTLQDFDSENFLPLVMATLNRFYKALEPIKDSLPERSLLHLAETRVNKIVDQAVKGFLLNLLQRWKKKFLRDLEETARTVVHGDLHASNMIINEGRLWLLDYGLCGRGYVIEDLARLSVYSHMNDEDESYMLRHWFEDKYGEELLKLFDACKVLSVFLWFLIEAQRLSPADVRGGIFAIDVGAFNDVAFARGAVDAVHPPLHHTRRLLGQSVRRLKEVCE